MYDMQTSFVWAEFFSKYQQLWFLCDVTTPLKREKRRSSCHATALLCIFLCCYATAYLNRALVFESMATIPDKLLFRGDVFKILWKFHLRHLSADPCDFVAMQASCCHASCCQANLEPHLHLHAVLISKASFYLKVFLLFNSVQSLFVLSWKVDQVIV